MLPALAGTSPVGVAVTWHWSKPFTRQRRRNENKNLCGRDGRTICGPQCVPKSTSVTLAVDEKNDNGTNGQTDRVRRNMRPPPREEGRITTHTTLTFSYLPVSFVFTIYATIHYVDVEVITGARAGIFACGYQLTTLKQESLISNHIARTTSTGVGRGMQGIWHSQLFMWGILICISP